jgi:hypothetical protein
MGALAAMQYLQDAVISLVLRHPHTKKDRKKFVVNT